MRKPLLFAPLALVLLTGCGPTKIGKIAADPYKYQNKNVRVQGTVANSFGAFVGGVYQVEDDTGKIYILSTNGAVPRKGATVQVSGKVMNGVTVAGRSFGQTIRESGHKVK